jgi:hypothetical protein
VGRGSRKTQHCRDAADIDLCKMLLRYNTCRAVVYRGLRLGVSIGLIIRLLRVFGLIFGETRGLSGASPTQASWLLPPRS